MCWLRPHSFNLSSFYHSSLRLPTVKPLKTGGTFHFEKGTVNSYGKMLNGIGSTNLGPTEVMTLKSGKIQVNYITYTSVYQLTTGVAWTVCCRKNQLLGWRDLYRMHDARGCLAWPLLGLIGYAHFKHYPERVQGGGDFSCTISSAMKNYGDQHVRF